MSVNTEEIPYDFELERLVEELKGVKKVLIQLPDGLKKYSYFIVDSLSRSLGNIEIMVSMDGGYGACDLKISEAKLLNTEALIHFGHTQYSLQEVPIESGKLRIIYVPAFYRGSIPESSVDSLAEALKREGLQRPSIVATVQHIRLIGELKAMLEKRGFHPIVTSPGRLLTGQIIGCDYSAVILSKEADSVVVITGGLFHSLGVSLSFEGPVFQIDPYSGRVGDLRKDKERWLKRRLAEMYRARDSRRWGIIVGTLTGQYRPSIVERLKREISSRGMKYYLFASSVLSKDNILNIDSENIDAYIVTSCPRIPIDDFTESPLHKPVLTPGEAISVLEGRIEVYRFPW
ncbi:MAG: diphthamide biosynthesis enzyme Dph2 [Fervidicoccaceae archaeon]